MTNITSWKSSFSEWSNSFLDSLSKTCNLKAPYFGTISNDNTTVIANSIQTIDTSIVTKNNFMRTVSLYQDKLLIGIINDRHLHVFQTNKNYVSSIRVSHKFFCAKWTHHGNILYVSNARGGLACLVSQSGQILKQHNTAGLTSINVVHGVIYLTAEKGFYISTDGGYTLILQNNFLKNKTLWKVIKVVTDRCELLWTIEEDDKLHLYSVVPISSMNALKEHMIQSLPPTLSKLEHSGMCDIAYDGRTNIFLTDFKNSKIHVFSVTGHYIGQLLDDIPGVCCLAVDEVHELVYVANWNNKIISCKYIRYI